MTIVAALEHDDAVWIACDSIVSSGDTVDALGSPKWRRRGDVIVAWCGDVSTAQAIETAHRRQRAPGVDVLAYVYRVAAQTRRTIRARRVAYSEVSLLVAVAGRVWSVDGNGAVMRSEWGYAAIGSGAELALGSLASTSGDPSARVVAAVRAACRHSSSCAEPVRVESIR
jgi:ATP-dependent protease HslVU (ClpYQ) peptidase subunit